MPPSPGLFQPRPVPFQHQEAMLRKALWWLCQSTALGLRVTKPLLSRGEERVIFL